jgi:hypothetical protein
VVKGEDSVFRASKRPSVGHPDAEIRSSASPLVREHDRPRPLTEQNADQPDPVGRPETHDAPALGSRHARLLKAKRRQPLGLGPRGGVGRRIVRGEAERQGQHGERGEFHACSAAARASSRSAAFAQPITASAQASPYILVSLG